VRGWRWLVTRLVRPEEASLTSDDLPHPESSLLGEFAAGALGGDNLDRVAVHLERCESCRAHVDRILSGDRLLDRMRLAATQAEESPSDRGELRRQAWALRRLIDSDTAATPVATPEPEGPEPPREFAGYEILREVGRGGMGVVYLARHRGLQRLVALKMILAGGFASEAQRQRFQREAELAARVQHPNIVQVYEAGIHGGRPFLAMEWVSGVTLADRIGIDPWPLADAAGLVETIARSIEAAHRKGVIHRDLKPSNILLQSDSVDGKPSGPLAGAVPKVADFGLARLIEGSDQLTSTGLAVGTPAYMAPEQARKGASVGPAADVYSLGAILYQLITGRPPFLGGTAIEVLQAQASAEPVPPRRLRRRLARDLETITLKALEKQPARRFASAGAMAEDLHRFLASEPILARPPTTLQRIVKWAQRRPALAALIVALTVVTVGAFAAITTLWVEAAGARDQARAATRDAERRSYRAAVAAAAAEIELNNLDAAADFLNAAPETYRNWEWHHFDAELDNTRSVFRPTDGAVSVFALAPTGERFAYAVAGAGDVRVRAPGALSDLAVFPGVGGTVTSIALSPDGLLLAVGSTDRTARVWRVADGRQIAVLPGHGGPVSKLIFAADGSRLVTLSDDKKARVWDTADSRCLAVFPANYLQISPDSRHVVAMVDRTAFLRVLSTGMVLRDLSTPNSYVICAAFRADSRQFATGTDAPTSAVFLWDVEQKNRPIVLSGHKNAVIWLAYSPDGRMVASSSVDKTVRLWDTSAAKALTILRGHQSTVREGAFSPDGRRLVTAAPDRTARAWDTVEGTLLSVFRSRVPSTGEPAVSRDGSVVAMADESGAVNFWDLDLAMRRGLLTGHTSYVYDVSVSPDGRTVASAAWDGTVRLWNLDEGRETSALRHANPSVTAVAFNPDGRRAASVARDGLILVWDLKSGRPERTIQLAYNSTHRTEYRVAFNPQGNLLVANGAPDKLVHLIDTNTGNEVATLAGHETNVTDAVFSFDGTRLASADAGGTVRFWSTARWTPLSAIKAHDDLIHRIAFSPDGRTLATASRDRTVRIWDNATLRQMATLRHGAAIYGLSFKPDGTRLATACDDGTVRLWDGATFEEVAELRGHGDYVHAVAFSPDGTQLVSGSGDYSVRVWDALPAIKRDPRSSSPPSR
jgi:WD40 repeat protein/serine/threonine protein kinase